MSEPIPSSAETPRDPADLPTQTQLTGPYIPLVGKAEPALAVVGEIGRYEIFGEIGRGGMGSVLRGRDAALGRYLAIKVLRAEHEDQPDMVRRFLAEARIGGGLQHPGIVPVYELGQAAATKEERPRPYFTMKLIEGRTLADLLAERREPLRELPLFLKVFEQVCQTVAYAHSRQIIHRDLKPLNIMVGAFGEVQIMDWGLAKALGESEDLTKGSSEPGPELRTTALTQVGMVLGTPAYMAPEQARAEVLDERGDVFGLGAILCEILTGRPPYEKRDGRGVHGVLEQAQRGDLMTAFARLDGCGADTDLVELAKDCLAPQTADRPRNAGKVAQRMTAYLNAVQDRLHAAERERAAAQARAEEAAAKAFAERKARRLTVTLAAFILLTVLGGAAGGLWIQQDRANRAAEKFARDTEDARKESETVQAISLTLEQARTEQEQGRYPAALAAARKAEGLLAGGGESMRQRVEEGIADLQMVARLEQVRLETVEMKSDQSGFDPSELMPRYQDAFDRYGIPVLTLEIGEAAERIRRRAIRAQLLAALDHWAFYSPQAETRRRLLAIAQAADPDPKGVMAALRQAAMDVNRKVFTQIVFSDERVKQLPPPFLVNVGAHLSVNGDADRAVQLLQGGLESHPEDFWLHYQLGYSLAQVKPPRLEEAIRHTTVAIALRPDVPGAWLNLGADLARQGRLTEAIDACTKAIKVKDDDALAYSNLGAVLEMQKESVKARAAYEEALRIQPSLVKAHYNLGTLLAKQQSWHEAEKHLREAIRLKPNYSDAHCDLGSVLNMRGRTDEALQSQQTALKYASGNDRIWQNLGKTQTRLKDFDEAAASFEKALQLNPDHAAAYVDLGFVRIQQRRLKEAVAALRKAVALQPNSFNANANLADALSRQGNLKEVIPVYRKMIELHPSPDMHGSLYYSIGTSLLQLGELPEAKAALEQAVKLKPDYAEARANLSKVFWGLGQFEEAKAHLTKARDLLGQHDPRRDQFLAALSDCDRMIRVVGKLPAILKGEDRPADNGERLLLAGYCQKNKHLYAASARLYGEAFAADAKLVDDVQSFHRYQAACAAVLAASGRGEDAATPDNKERLRWRKQALDWLRADLALWSKRQKGSGAERDQVSRTLRYWQQDTNLAAVREDAMQVWLPGEERLAWRKLWTEVNELLTKAEP